LGAGLVGGGEEFGLGGRGGFVRRRQQLGFGRHGGICGRAFRFQGNDWLTFRERKFALGASTLRRLLGRLLWLALDNLTFERLLRDQGLALSDLSLERLLLDHLRLAFDNLALGRLFGRLLRVAFDNLTFERLLRDLWLALRGLSLERLIDHLRLAFDSLAVGRLFGRHLRVALGNLTFERLLDDLWLTFDDLAFSRLLGRQLGFAFGRLSVSRRGIDRGVRIGRDAAVLLHDRLALCGLLGGKRGDADEKGGDGDGRCHRPDARRENGTCGHGDHSCWLAHFTSPQTG